VFTKFIKKCNLISPCAYQTQLSAKKTEADDKILRAKQPKRRGGDEQGAWQGVQVTKAPTTATSLHKRLTSDFHT